MRTTTAAGARLDQELSAVRAQLADVKHEVNQAIQQMTAPTGTADFFQPGRVYASRDVDIQFRCEHLSTHPTTGELIAWGWFTLNVRNPHWTGREMKRHNFHGWTDITADLK